MTGHQLKGALEASRTVKENSKIPVVWGGVHATIMPRQTIENSLVDFVVEGEGEETFTELVQALEQGSSPDRVRSIWYKKNGEVIKTSPRPFVDLNKQPHLSYELLGNPHIEKLHFFTARGCPHRCSYCYNLFVNKETWRALTPQETIKRLERITNVLKDLKHIYFIDDNFFVDLARARGIIEGLVKFQIPWSTHIRIDTLAKLDESFLDLLDKSLCSHLLIGMESGSPKILKLMQKELSIKESILTNQRIARHNFYPVYNFVLGLPTETKDDIRQTIQLIEQLLKDNPHAVKNFNIFTPYPGNYLYEMAVAHGFQAPKNLEGWFELKIKNVSHKSWLSPEMKDIITMLLFCSAFLDMDRKFFRQSTSLTKLIATLYQPFARFRVKNLYAGLPLEIQLGRYLGYLG